MDFREKRPCSFVLKRLRTSQIHQGPIFRTFFPGKIVFFQEFPRKITFQGKKMYEKLAPAEA
jgi:hypothetical protein